MSLKNETTILSCLSHFTLFTSSLLSLTSSLSTYFLCFYLLSFFRFSLALSFFLFLCLSFKSVESKEQARAVSSRFIYNRRESAREQARAVSSRFIYNR